MLGRERSTRTKIRLRIRSKVAGTEARPRLSVFRSNKAIYAQIIDDAQGKTLVSASSLNMESGTKKERAYKLGLSLAKKALEQKVSKVVFDRGGYIYHGRVEELAHGARDGGLDF